MDKSTQAPLNSASIEKRERYKSIAKKIAIYGFLTSVALYILLPLYWMLVSGLKTYQEYLITPPTLIPNNPTLDNFITVLTDENNPILLYMKNTLVVGIISTIGTLITTILAAFAFSKLNFKGSGAVFGLLLSTMMIPGEMYVITNYITVSNLGWYDTFAALIVPFIVSVFYVYLLRQAFMQIPNELYLAAKVDGKSDWQFLWKVMVPMCKPTIITITILKIIGSWNAYVWPELVTTSQSVKMISGGLRNIADLIGEADIIPHDEITMAASLIVSVPVIVAFILLRKYIMSGVGRSGTKG